MRRKWMVMLVVMVTTLTTAQEALRQYDGLKSQAATWATLRLWTGLLNAYTPQDEQFRAQLMTSAVNNASAQAQRPAATALDQGIKIKSVKVRKQGTSSQLARVEELALEDSHRESFKAAAEAPDSIKEVALLNETGGRGLEELLEPADERTEPGATSDEGEADSARNAFTEVRLASRVADGVAVEAAPLAGDADADAAIRRPSRTASRSQAQKARAIKRALKLLQIQLERTNRPELKIAAGEFRVELPRGINMALRAPGNTSGITADLPSLSPQPFTPPALAAVTAVGGCAGE